MTDPSYFDIVRQVVESMGEELIEELLKACPELAQDEPHPDAEPVAFALVASVERKSKERVETVIVPRVVADEPGRQTWPYIEAMLEDAARAARDG